MDSQVVSHFYQVGLPDKIALQSIQIAPLWDAAEAVLRRDSSAPDVPAHSTAAGGGGQESAATSVLGGESATASTTTPHHAAYHKEESTADMPTQPPLPDGVVTKKSPHPLEYTYQPQVLDAYAATPKDELPQHMPMVLTKEDGTKMYGACVVVYEKPQGALRRQLKYLCRAWYLKNINKSDIEYLSYIRSQINLQRQKVQDLSAKIQDRASTAGDGQSGQQGQLARRSSESLGGDLHEQLQAAEDTLKLFDNLLKPFVTNACVEPNNLWVPRAVGLLSYWPFYQFMEDWLKCVVDDLENLRSGTHTTPLESYVVNLFHELPFPPLGRKEVCLSVRNNLLHLHRPPPNDIALIKNFSFFPLFRSMSLESILYIIESVLSEKKIVFISKSLAALTSACETITTLIFPFYWFHIFIPVLPAALVGYLQAPVPFIVGMHKSYAPSTSELEDVLVVELDENRVTSNLAEPPMPLPQRQKSKLLGRLRSICRIPAAGLPLECSETYPLGRLLLRSSRSVVPEKDAARSPQSSAPSSASSDRLSSSPQRRTSASSLSIGSGGSQEAMDTAPPMATQPPLIRRLSSGRSSSADVSNKPPHTLQPQPPELPKGKRLSTSSVLPPKRASAVAITSLNNNSSGSLLAGDTAARPPSNYSGSGNSSATPSGEGTHTSKISKRSSLSLRIFSSTSSILTGVTSATGGSRISSAAAGIMRQKRIVEGHSLVEVRALTSPEGVMPLSGGNGTLATPTSGSEAANVDAELPCNVCKALMREATWRCTECGFYVHDSCINAVCFACPVAFHESKIRRMFLKLFVSLMKTYANYLNTSRATSEDYVDVDTVFAKKKFIDSCDFENRSFTTAFVETQAFAQFIMDRVQLGTNKDSDYELLLFDEHIKEKLGRSRLSFRKETSNFLRAREVPPVETVHASNDQIGTPAGVEAPPTPNLTTSLAALNDTTIRSFPLLRPDVLAAIPRRETRSLTTPQEEILMTVHMARMARQARLRMERAKRTESSGSATGIAAVAWWARKAVSPSADSPAAAPFDMEAVIADPKLGEGEIVNEQKRELIESKISQAMNLLKEPEITSPAKSRETYRNVIQQLATHSTTLKDLIVTADPKKSDLDDIILLTSQMDKLRNIFEQEMRDIFVDDYDKITKPTPLLDLSFDVSADFSREFSMFGATAVTTTQQQQQEQQADNTASPVLKQSVPVVAKPADVRAASTPPKVLARIATQSSPASQRTPSPSLRGHQEQPSLTQPLQVAESADDSPRQEPLPRQSRSLSKSQLLDQVLGELMEVAQDDAPAPASSAGSEKISEVSPDDKDSADEPVMSRLPRLSQPAQPDSEYVATTSAEQAAPKSDQDNADTEADNNVVLQEAADPAVC
ncbi:hypothetical protein RI367_004423 [Sorochytrium milnesiophthora]